MEALYLSLGRHKPQFYVNKVHKNYKEEEIHNNKESPKNKNMIKLI